MSFFTVSRQAPGAAASARKGLFAAHRWLLLRRLSQLTILGLFLAGPWFGSWIVKGNLASSLLLDTVPMTDLFLLAQTLASGHWPYLTAWIGGGVVLAFYLLVGGRVYCSWVCPVNMLTDAAAWSRRRLGLKTGRTPPRSLRFWLLGAVLLASALAGTMVWEWVNPVSTLQRAIIFGGVMGWATLAWLIVGGVFVYDLFLAPRGWCGHVCPMGACYNLVNKAALVRVAADQRAACNDCMDCFTVCPEPQVIRPALKGSGTPLITSSDCTNCGRCIDVCSENVFHITLRTSRFNSRREAS
ncbi:MAG TPA: quinol dehydrogenase ferredoxin subunit NapH [Rhodocyclaceae bacterium]|nr:quinol dehydrogenase ferredoxin subunit NapH [Rhodocyclaceae bacterium]